MNKIFRYDFDVKETEKGKKSIIRRQDYKIEYMKKRQQKKYEMKWNTICSHNNKWLLIWLHVHSITRKKNILYKINRKWNELQKQRRKIKQSTYSNKECTKLQWQQYSSIVKWSNWVPFIKTKEKTEFRYVLIFLGLISFSIP